MVADLIRENTELRRAQAPPIPLPAPPVAPPRRQDGNFRDSLAILEHMRSIGTRRFQGTTNPIEADAWLEGLIKNLTVSRCPDEYKKDVAVFFLERDANHWWKRVAGRYGNTVIRWEDFQREFENKYFPREARERLEVQFLELRQGNLSIREYETEFTRLSQYVSGGIQEEDALIRKFIRGMEPCVRNRLQATKFQSLYELVECAVLVEEGMVEENAIIRAQVAPTVVTPRVNRREDTRRNTSGRNARYGRSGQGRVVPFCSQCRSRHSGPCRQVQPTVCYNCRMEGHIARDCTNKAKPDTAPAAVNVTCFHCGETGHFATSCPQKGARPRTNRPDGPPAKRPAIAARVYALHAAGPSDTTTDGSQDKGKGPIAG